MRTAGRRYFRTLPGTTPCSTPTGTHTGRGERIKKSKPDFDVWKTQIRNRQVLFQRMFTPAVSALRTLSPNPRGVERSVLCQSSFSSSLASHSDSIFFVLQLTKGRLDTRLEWFGLICYWISNAEPSRTTTKQLKLKSGALETISAEFSIRLLSVQETLFFQLGNLLPQLFPSPSLLSSLRN